MAAAALTALLSVALAGIDGTAVELQAGGRTESSTRAAVRDGVGTQTLANVDVLPRLALLLDRHTVRLTLGYEPQLRLARDLGAAGTDARVAHGGSAALRWDLAPGWRLASEGRASMRLVDFAAASALELARLPELRAPTTVRYANAALSASLEGRPARGLAVASRVALESSGGLGGDGRLALPGLREIRAAASVARDQTPVDVLRLEVAAERAAFEGRGTASVGTLTAGWAREAARDLRLRLAAGASGVSDAASARAVPEAAVALEYAPDAFPSPLRAAAGVRTGAAVDRWGARVQDRLVLDGDVAWSPSRRWTLRALGSRGWVLEARGVEAARGDLRAAWRASPRVTLSGGAWMEWQRDPRLQAGQNVSYWGTTLAVELAPLGRLPP